MKNMYNVLETVCAYFLGFIAILLAVVITFLPVVVYSFIVSLVIYLVYHFLKLLGVL